MNLVPRLAVLRRQLLRTVSAIEDPAEFAIKREVVIGTQRMRNDDVRNRFAQNRHLRAIVLVNVDDEMRRLAGDYLDQVDVFGATDLRDASDFAARMDAESCASDDAVAEVKGEEKFGEAGD